MSAPTLDTFLGCLVGAAIGDALGAPISGHPRASVTLPPTGQLDYMRLPTYPFGQTTDDTQMMLAVARSIARKGSIDGQTMAQGLQELWASGEVIAPRETCTQAIQTMQANTKPWYAAGVPAPCPDVGSVTRVAPIGLWCCEKTRDLVRDAELCSSLTHGDERAGAAAVAVARAVAFMGTHTEILPERCLYRIGLAAGQVLPAFADWAVDLGELLALPPVEAEEGVRRIGDMREEDGVEVPLWSNVVQVVLWALYCAVRYPQDYVTAMRTALGAGGEADASGAIVGAIVGTHVGLDGLPPHLVNDLWEGATIREIGETLFAGYEAAVGTASAD